MRVVYKYLLEVGDDNSIRMPGLLKVVHVAQADAVGRQLYVWCEVDTETEQQTSFEIYGTGHAILVKDQIHCGTVVTTSGLVWHVYVSERYFRIRV